jgi:anaerobic C4-dicarboxylate transporter
MNYLMIFLLSFLVILGTISWEITLIFTKDDYPSWGMYLFLILAIFALIYSYKKLKTQNPSLPQKDEMTRRRSEKAATYSFYIIIFIVLYLIQMPEKPLITMEMIRHWGAGAIMAIYGICWLIIYFRGIKDE